MKRSQLEHVIRAAATIVNQTDHGAIGRCLDPEDLGVAKLAAGRAKDLEFVREAIAIGLMSQDVLAARIRTLDDPRADQARLMGLLARCQGE